jgi:hypothetical protein
MPWFIFISAISNAVSFSFLGPIPYFNIKLTLPIFLTAFVMYGISFGALAVPVYSDLVRIAGAHGYPNDLRTQGLVSGIFSSIFSTGFDFDSFILIVNFSMKIIISECLLGL